jgi:hypothetical protein
MQRSHEEETQWNQCIVNAFNKSGCGNLTEAEIAQNCGSPINSNSTICPVSRSPCSSSPSWHMHAVKTACAP